MEEENKSQENRFSDLSPEPEQEISVLDYLKSKLIPWEKNKFQLPPQLEDISEGKAEQREKTKLALPGLALGGLFLALIAQRTLEPGNGDRQWIAGLILYLFAAFLFLWAIRKNEITVSPLYEESEKRIDLGEIRWVYLLLCVLFSVSAFVTFRQNTFNFINVLFWFLAILCAVIAFWKPEENGAPIWQRVKSLLSQPPWNIKITPWTFAVLGVCGLVIFFRFYQLASVPSQMISDQAEKLFDVADVMNGKFSIFFPRNTGREAFQFYWTAMINLMMGTGVNFMNLKIGTVLIGIFTLPYLYLLGKELGSRRIGLFAVLFAGMAYWANVISRFGLRYPLYPMFAAPALYYLIRGLRTMRRNDFIFAGIFLGIGLHGYSPFRIVPIILVIMVGIYLLHRQSKQSRIQAVQGLLILAFISLIIFLPLLRYAVENPDMISYRALTRLSTLERPLPGNGLTIFFSNLYKALISFYWDNGEVWVISVVHRPMLDVVSAALLTMGVLYVIVRYLQKRNWLDLFLLLSIPLLMMPSIFSLAFPGENPCLNRTSGAIIPVFLIIGIALDRTLEAVTRKMNRRGNWVAGFILAGLVLVSGLQNYNLVFNQYRQVFDQSSWNTSEMGEVVQNFTRIVGTADTVWIVGFPHWADSRAVMINAGYIRDNAIWPEDFLATLDDPRAKLFIVNLRDFEALIKLKALYPEGYLQRYISKVPTKDFWVFTVPPKDTFNIQLEE